MDDLLRMGFEDLVELIARVNWCWHVMRDRDPECPVARALRDRKTGLQLELLRDHSEHVRLFRDDSQSDDLYSIRLLRTVPLRDEAGTLHDAMHMRVEQAHSYLTETELLAVVQPSEQYEVSRGQ